jgi:hypothetical protein
MMEGGTNMVGIMPAFGAAVFMIGCSGALRRSFKPRAT